MPDSKPMETKSAPLQHGDPVTVPEDKTLSRFERYTIISAGIGVFLTAATGALIYWQARVSALTLVEIRAGGEDTRKLAESAKRQADIAEKQAGIAEKALQATVSVARQDQRPWVG